MGHHAGGHGGAKKIALSLLTLLLCLLAAEFVLRRAQPRATVPRWFVTHPRYGYFHRPGYHDVFHYANASATWELRLNQLGLRGPELELDRADDRRILFVGDSFTFGYGLNVEDLFPFKVGAALSGMARETWTVINAGVGGWGTLQQMLYATDNLDHFRPDVVVLTFCDNDIQDDELFLRGAASGLLPEFPGKRWLRDHCELYRSAYAALAPLLLTKTLVREEPGGAASPAPPGDVPSPRAEDLVAPLAHLWPRTRGAIRTFHEEFLRRNPDGLLLIQHAQPDRADIYHALRTLDNGRSMLFVNLALDLQRLKITDILLPYDPHWTPQMHSVSAERLVGAVRAHGRFGELTVPAGE